MLFTKSVIQLRKSKLKLVFDVLSRAILGYCHLEPFNQLSKCLISVSTDSKAHHPVVAMQLVGAKPT